MWPPTDADLDRLAVVWLDEAERVRHEATLAGRVSRVPSPAATVAPATPGGSVTPGASVTPHAAASRVPAPPTLNWPPSADDLRAITVLERGSQPVPIAPDAAVPAPVPGLPAPVPIGTPVTTRSSRLQLAAVALCAVVVIAATARPMLDRLRQPAPPPTPTLAVHDDVAGVAAPSARPEAPASAKNTAIPSPPPDQLHVARAARKDEVVRGAPLALDREPTRAPTPRPAPERDREPMAARERPVAGAGIAAPAGPPALRGPDESAPPPALRADTAPPPALRADATPPSAPRADATPAVAAPETVAAPLPEPPPTLPARVTIAGVPSSAGAGGSDADRRTATRIPAPPNDEARIRATLGRYRTAYQQLDASAAKAVWPSVDQRALAKAFGGLRLQEVVFDACRLSLGGETAAATCQGRATYVARVGNGEPRVQPRQWTFELRRVGANWVIQDVRVR